MNPHVSVIIPMYNAERTIAEALASLQASSIADFEALVVNDGSTDHSPVMVEQLAASDRRIRQIHRRNGGLSAARNTGLDHATGAWVHFLDADDWIAPDGLRRLVAAAERGQTAAAAGAFEIRSASGDVLAIEHAALPSFGLDDLLDLHFVIANSLLFKRDVFEAPARLRFDESCARVEDYDLWLRLAESGVRWTSAGGSPVCGYRISASTLSTAHAAMLHGAQDVFARSFARCREGRLRGVDRRMLDLSPRREADRQGLIALNWATRMVVSRGRSAIDEAAALYEGALGHKQIEANRAAGCALGSVLVALGRRPVMDGLSERDWAPALMAWWTVCVARGWARADLPAKAAAALADQTALPADVVRALLDRTRDHRTLVLLGFGRNGRVLAEAARRDGRDVRVRDDRFADGCIPPGHELAGVSGERMDAPIPPGAALIATPLDDGSLASRFADHAGLIRWTDVRHGLARLAAQRVMAYLPEVAATR